MKKRLSRKASVVLHRYIETLESRVLLTGTNHLAFITQPTDTTAGGTIDPQVIVAVENSSDKVVTTDTSNVTISITSSTGPDGASLGGTLTLAASDGLATFDDLALTAAGSGSSAYGLTAKDGSYTSADSNTFNITPAAPSKLAFNQGPTAVKAGATMSPTVTVDVEDQYGNVVTTDSSTVDLAVATGPSKLPPKQTGKKVSATPVPATLGGTVIIPVDSGVAKFTDLELDTAGTYTLAATDAKLTAATSSSFAVSAGTAAQVAFGTAPASGTVGSLGTITGQVEDKFGNVVTTDTSTMAFGLVSSPDGAIYSGTPGGRATAGIVTLSDLVFNTAGTYSVELSDGSLASAVSPSFILAAGTATKLAYKQAPTSTTAGVAINPVVTVMVEDQYGNLVPTDKSKVTVAIGTGPDGAALGGAATVAAVKGIATLKGLTLNTSGSYTLAVSDASLTAATSGTFTVAPGAALKLAFKSQPTDAVAGVKLSPSVTVDVEDKFGNIVTTDSSTVALALGPGAGSASITGTASAAASSGVATFANLKVNTAGTFKLAATDAKLTAAASSAFNITPASAAQLAVSAVPASVVAGATIPAVKVSIEDAFGNVITGDTSSVTLAIASGTGPDGATLGGTLTEAAVAGVATFSDLSLTASDAGATAYKLKATDGELTAGSSGSFDVGATAASQVVFKTGPTNAVAGAAISPSVTVQVEDKYGNVVTTNASKVTLAITTGPSHSAPKLIGKKVSSVPVNASITGTTTVAAVNGLATFSNISFNFAGAYTITAADAKLTPATSSSFTIAPGAASQVVFGTGPVAATAGATLTAITAQVEDANGNVVTGDTSKITVAIASGPNGASLGGTLKVSAVAGVATFSDLALQTAGAYTIGATDGSLTAATSAAFVISPGAAAKLAGMQAPNSFIAGAANTPPATMAVEDQYGNIVTTDKSKVTATISTGPSSAVLAGTASATAAAGIVTFSNLVFDTAGSYSLAFADGSLTGLGTGSFTVVAAAPAKLAFGQAPAATTAGVKQSPAVTVDVEDKFGNVVTTDNSAVTLTIASAPLSGPVGGLATLHASSGVATFSNLAFNLVGNYSLRASDAALTAATSAAFAISPAAAAKLAFVKTPTTEIAGVKIAPGITVQVLDKYGNLINTDTSNVTLGITNGTGPSGTTLGGTLSQAAVKGIATFADIALNTVGRYRLTATDGSLTSSISSPFSVIPAAASHVVFDQAPTDTVAGSVISPNVTVDVEDKFGNLVTTDSKSKVTVAIAGPTGAKMTGTLTQTAVNGIATFNDLTPSVAGASTLTASDAKLAPDTSDSFTVSPGTANKLVFSGVPATGTAGAAFSNFTVQVEDALGNIVTGNTSLVSLGIASGPDSAELGGAATQVNAVAGVATFSGIMIEAAGTFTLSATDGSLTSATSGNLVNNPGVGRSVLQIQRPTDAVAGAAISPTISYAVMDNEGNIVTTDSTSKMMVAITSGPTGAAITGTTTVPVVKGIATFTGLSLKTAGDYKFTFSDGSLTTLQSSTFTISPATATKLAFAQAPTPAVAAAKISPSIKVDVEDQFGNIVTGDSSNVVLAVGTTVTGATLGGTLTEAASSGVATFDDITLDKAGSYTLKATDGSLTLIASSTFAISAAS